LFGMGFASQNLLHHPGAVRAQGLGPRDKSTRSPLQLLLMGLGPMFIERGKALLLMAPLMGRDSPPDATEPSLAVVWMSLMSALWGGGNRVIDPEVASD